MRGLHHKLTVCRPLVPLEELSINLNAPSHNPFELSEVVGLKFLLLKTALPFGLTQSSKLGSYSLCSFSRHVYS